MTNQEITIKVLRNLQKELRKKEIKLDKIQDSYYQTKGIDEEAFEFEDLRAYLEEDLSIYNDMSFQLGHLIEFIKKPKRNYTNEEYKKKIQKIIKNQLNK